MFFATSVAIMGYKVARLPAGGGECLIEALAQFFCEDLDEGLDEKSAGIERLFDDVQSSGYHVAPSIKPIAKKCIISLGLEHGQLARRAKGWR